MNYVFVCVCVCVAEEKKTNESSEWEDVWNEITPGKVFLFLWSPVVTVK